MDTDKDATKAMNTTSKIFVLILLKKLIRFFLKPLKEHLKFLRNVPLTESFTEDCFIKKTDSLRVCITLSATPVRLPMRYAQA